MASSILEFIAVISAALFAGAALYINVAEHPARMGLETRLAALQWAPSYKRATVMQASLAAIGFLSATGASLLGAGGTWLVGGILLGLVIPFTLIVILPTNRKLLSPDLVKESPGPQYIRQHSSGTSNGNRVSGALVLPIVSTFNDPTRISSFVRFVNLINTNMSAGKYCFTSLRTNHINDGMIIPTTSPFRLGDCSIDAGDGTLGDGYKKRRRSTN